MPKITPVKPFIRLYKPDETRKLCSFIVPENKAGELSINVKEDISGPDYKFLTELKNKSGQILGFENYSHFNNTDYMTGLLINVTPKYRRKNYFFGEILRLASIIQMLENNINIFFIKSKDTAIYFHAKYKFEPSIKSFSERDKLLETVVNDTSPDFKALSLKGVNLIQKINKCTSFKEQRHLCEETNKLLTEYINLVLSEQKQKDHKFNWPMDMVLKKDTILKNKNYFNNLFVKHNINYKI